MEKEKNQRSRESNPYTLKHYNIGSDGMSYERCKCFERFKSNCLLRTVRQGGPRMVWVCFSYGVGDLALFDGK